MVPLEEHDRTTSRAVPRLATANYAASGIGAARKASIIATN